MLLTLVLLAVAAAENPPGGLTHPPTLTIEDDNLRRLLQVRKIFVDRLSGGDTATQMRDMILSSLVGTNRFAITENQEGADAILRGSAEDLVFTDVHNTSDNINVRANVGRGRTASRDSRGDYAGVGGGESETSHIAERRHEAMAAVRLVNKDGDLIWATTQESLGSKFRGSSADVADKIIRRLLDDLEKAQRLRK
jgi:hypothetical protein